MVELSQKTACEGLLPLRVGNLVLEEVAAGILTSLSAIGDPAGLSRALEAGHGMALPGPNKVTGKEGGRCIWFGLREVLLMGPSPDSTLGSHAAVVDQSDGWAVVRLSGEGVEDVLARLAPVDLRSQNFKRGHTVRTQLGHMNASISRTGADALMIVVFRSMAATLVHELKIAMAAVVSRR